MQEFHLIAFGLPILIFLFWGIVGYAALSALHSARNILQNLLLAPTVGVAFTLLPVFILSRVGLPVEKFALTLTLILFVSSVAVLFYKKPIFPFKRYLPFVLILLLGLWLTGKPLLEFGFDWLSYANDDMANYCLGASRFVHQGYSTVPDITQMLQGKDYSLYYWLLHVPAMVRAGSELLLAWLSVITNKTTLQIFMPLIMAIYLGLISATCALIYSNKKWRNAALGAGFLLVFSSMTSLGVLYQLIAQVAGLTLFLGLTVLLYKPINSNFSYYTITDSLIFTFLFSTLLITYPEITPFLFLSYFLYLALLCLNGWRPNNNYFAFCILIFLGTFLVLNTYITNYLYFLLFQLKVGVAKNVFPTLIQACFASLWGLQTVASSISEPWNFLTIMLGGGLFALLLYIVLFILWRYKHPIAIVTLTMLGVFGYLLIQKADFGLFKLMMYVQPFMLGSISIFVFATISNVLWRTIPLVLLVIFSVNAQATYVERSRDLNFGNFTEVPYASISKINSQLEEIQKKLPRNSQVISDATDSSLAKLQALYFKGHPSFFLSCSSCFYITPNSYAVISNLAAVHPALMQPTKEIFEKNLVTQANEHFHLDSLSESESITNNFMLPTVPFKQLSNTFLIASTPLQSVFNRWDFNGDKFKSFIVQPWEKVKNHLIFIGSDLGEPYYVLRDTIKDTTQKSLFQLQGDYFYPQDSLAALGKYLLFYVVNPTEKIHVVVNITDTSNGQGNTQLPTVSIIGADKYSLPILGSGSARIFSNIVAPQVINGNPFLMLEFNNKSEATEIGAGSFTTLARDISIISDEEYKNLLPPAGISLFPQDLQNKNLEYSGIYEDGWMAGAAYFMLLQPKNFTRFEVKGNVPQCNLDMKSEILCILINNKKMWEQTLFPGKFDVNIPVPVYSSISKVELKFSKTQILPKGDGRPVGALISFIGFKNNK